MTSDAAAPRANPGAVDAPFRLDGKVAVVTGASSGLGRHIAMTLHDAGATLMATARRTAELEELTAGLPAAAYVAGDLTDPGDRARIVEATLEAFGRVDVLVNNAGWAQAVEARSESLDAFARAVEVDLVAPFDLAVRAAGAMPTGGSIVNVASVAALRSFDRYPLAGYAAAKTGLAGLTRELAAQWGPSGVRVNAVAPGWFPTRMTGHFEDEEQREWVAARAPLRRPGRLEELSAAVRFLASGAASYITGQVLAVDGGWTVY